MSYTVVVTQTPEPYNSSYSVSRPSVTVEEFRQTVARLDLWDVIQVVNGAKIGVTLEAVAPRAVGKTDHVGAKA